MYKFVGYRKRRFLVLIMSSFSILELLTIEDFQGRIEGNTFLYLLRKKQSQKEFFFLEYENRAHILVLKV